MGIMHRKKVNATKEKMTTQNRPKTFKTEEAAKKWAESKGIKDYDLVNVRTLGATDKKLKVVAK